MQSKCIPPGRSLFSPIRTHKRNVSFFIPFLVMGAGSVTRVLWDTEMFTTLGLYTRVPPLAEVYCPISENPHIWCTVGN